MNLTVDCETSELMTQLRSIGAVLTGSRRFNRTSPHSDTDVFCQRHPKLTAFLYQYGFQPKPGHYNEEVWTNGLIDVQVCSKKGYEQKVKVHNLLDSWPSLVSFMYGLDKKERMRLWQALMKLPI